MFGADAVCVFCGWSNPTALRAVGKTLLEEHHVVGVNHYDEYRVPVCRNCHALLTEGGMEFGVDLRTQRSLPETLAEMLRARAVAERQAADMDLEMAIKLERHVESLRNTHPDWRSTHETENK